jgi:ABC-type nickel/cobalt efflux system permease component RcnA
MDLSRLRKFRASLGPVEQAQVVVSTAVVVTLVTILVIRMSGGMYRTPEWLLFGSILTVGVFGFIIVLLTLKYGRLLEEQKKELLALKTMAESVNRSRTHSKPSCNYLASNACGSISLTVHG